MVFILGLVALIVSSVLLGVSIAIGHNGPALIWLALAAVNAATVVMQRDKQ